MGVKAMHQLVSLTSKAAVNIEAQDQLVAAQACSSPFCMVQ